MARSDPAGRRAILAETKGDQVFTWADFELAAPDLAAAGRELIERPGLVYVGTIRTDGTPRISPVEARIVQGRLMLNMVLGSLKARDLLRDPRILLHSGVAVAEDAAEELKLRGRAVEIRDPELCRATANVTWRPPPESRFFAVDLEHAAFVVWKSGEMTVTRWSRARGLH